MKPPYRVRFQTRGEHSRGPITSFEVVGPNDYSITYFPRNTSEEAIQEAHDEAHAHCNRLNASYLSSRTYTIDELIGEEGKRP